MARLMLNFALFGTFLVFYGVSYSTLQTYQASMPRGKNQASLWLLPPNALKAIAGEFKGLIADLIVLEAGAQLGTELKRTHDGKYTVVKKERDWPTIHKLFTNSQALDPSFQQTYLLAQGWLPWDANMVEETHSILRTASKNRPWDWRPLHLIGFNTYYFLNNPGKAGKIFIEASKTPNAPPFLAILGARLAQKGGETKAAIVLMKSMLKDKTPSDPGYDDIMDRLYALEGTYLLEEAVEKYRATYNITPQSFDDLLASGILNRLPPNPYSLPYCIDETGTIFFDNPNCRKVK